MATRYQIEKAEFFEHLDSACDYDYVEDKPLIALLGKRKRIVSQSSTQELKLISKKQHQFSVSSQPRKALKDQNDILAARVDTGYQSTGSLEYEVVKVLENRSGSISKSKKQGLRSDRNGLGLASKPRKIMQKTIPSKRRKKDRSAVTLQPEELQIFKGLRFFFIPNDDIAPARRMRIRKTIEWGALWTRKVDSNTTHLIADSGISYQCVLEHLGLDKIPSHVIVVNELYASECIRLGGLINPLSGYLRVDGTPEDLPGKPSARNDAGEVNSAHSSLKRYMTNRKRTSRGIDILVARMPTAKPEESHILTDKNRGTFSENPKSVSDGSVQKLQHVSNSLYDMGSNESMPNQISSQPDEQHLQAIEGNSNSFQGNTRSNFACMQKYDEKSRDQNPNAKTIAVLQEMQNHYENTKDTWRSIGYRKAISKLRIQNHFISSAEEAMALTNIGPKLAMKIEEIAATDRLQRLENTRTDPRDRLLRLFSNIYGVGFSQASKWIAQGLTTIAEVEQLNLNPSQRIGINHYNDFLTRIPRSEVHILGAIVSSVSKTLDPDLEIHIMGSYRREANDCGDVDILLTVRNRSKEDIRQLLLDKLIPRLFEIGFLKAGLAVPKNESGTKWHGACCAPGSNVWRRIDFLLVPYQELGAAMLYFTGSDIFNRSIRLLASRRNMRLNQHGLWRDESRGRFRTRLTRGSLVESESEKKIFEILGVPWRPPEHRNC